jgi:hypothetical protein
MSRKTKQVNGNQLFVSESTGGVSQLSAAFARLLLLWRLPILTAARKRKSAAPTLFITDQSSSFESRDEVRSC